MLPTVSEVEILGLPGAVVLANEVTDDCGYAGTFGAAQTVADVVDNYFGTLLGVKAVMRIDSVLVSVKNIGLESLPMSW